MQETLHCSFLASNTVTPQRQKSYTIYEIEVLSSSTFKWLIYKRYSDFFSLHAELTKFMGSNAHTATIKLPELPPKSITRSLAPEFVEKRRTDLQLYLRRLFLITEVFHCDFFLKFLQIPENVLPLMRASYHEEDVSPDEKSGLFVPTNQEEHKVLELLSRLRVRDDYSSKVGAIKQFSEYFFEMRPHLNQEYIKLLLQGDRSDKSSQGLIQICGDFSYSHVSAIAALQLICQLLDVEKNKDAQLFIDSFKHLDTQTIKKLHLHTHAKDQNTRSLVFNCVFIMRDVAPVDIFLPDSVVRQDYLQWIDLETSKSLHPFINPPPQEQFLTLSLKDIDYQAISSQCFVDLAEVQRDERGWRDVGGDSDTGVNITYKKDLFRDVVSIRVVAAIPHEIGHVFDLLMDLKHMPDWDVKCQSASHIETIDNSTDVIQIIFKSFNSPYRNRDFCLLRCVTKQEGNFTIGLRSIIHPNVSERDNVKAAVMLSSGWILQPCLCTVEAPDTKPVDIPSTILTFIAQMDREGIMIYSPDLLGETDDVAQSYLRLKLYLDDQLK